MACKYHGNGFENKPILIAKDDDGKLLNMIYIVGNHMYLDSTGKGFRAEKISHCPKCGEELASVFSEKGILVKLQKFDNVPGIIIPKDILILGKIKLTQHLSFEFSVTDDHKVLINHSNQKRVSYTNQNFSKLKDGLILKIPNEYLVQARIKAEDQLKVYVNNSNQLELEKVTNKSINDLFKDFDYKKYWREWEKEHPGQSKEVDWGGPQGREIW